MPAPVPSSCTTIGTPVIWLNTSASVWAIFAVASEAPGGVRTDPIQTPFVKSVTGLGAISSLSLTNTMSQAEFAAVGCDGFGRAVRRSFSSCHVLANSCTGAHSELAWAHVLAASAEPRHNTTAQVQT